MKRFTAVLLSVVLLLTLNVTVFASSNQSKVEYREWTSKELDSALDKGINQFSNKSIADKVRLQTTAKIDNMVVNTNIAQCAQLISRETTADGKVIEKYQTTSRFSYIDSHDNSASSGTITVYARINLNIIYNGAYISFSLSTSQHKVKYSSTHTATRLDKENTIFTGIGEANIVRTGSTNNPASSTWYSLSPASGTIYSIDAGTGVTIGAKTTANFVDAPSLYVENSINPGQIYNS